MGRGNPNFGLNDPNRFNYGRDRPFDSKILLRLYSEDRDKLEAIAAESGQSVSDLLRSLIESRVKKEEGRRKNK